MRGMEVIPLSSNISRSLDGLQWATRCDGAQMVVLSQYKPFTPNTGKADASELHVHRRAEEVSILS